MRDSFPFLQSLTLPIDAGPGDPRIELDGINGEIRVYDSTGTLVGRWDSSDFRVNHPTNGALIIVDPDNGGAPSIRFLPPPGTGYGTGSVSGIVDGLGTPLLSLVSPIITGEAGSVLNMFGENSADGVRAGIVIDVDNGELSQVQSGDLGVIGGGYRRDDSTTSTSAAVTTEAVVLTITNMEFRDGRAYLASYGSILQTSTAPSAGLFRLRETNATGTLYGNSGRIPTDSASEDYHAQGHWYLRRNFGAGDLTTDVVLTLESGGGNAFHVASAQAPRFLLIEDIGSADAYQYAVSVT